MTVPYRTRYASIDGNRVFTQPGPVPDFREDAKRSVEVTDWTRAFAVVNYEQAVEPFRTTKRLSESERAMLMGGACAKAYGWSPTQGYGPVN